MIDPGLFNPGPLSSPAEIVTVWTITPTTLTLIAAAVAAVAFGLGWISGYGWRGKHGSS